MVRPRPTLEFRRGDELQTHVVASPDATWFAGHFPARPLLPGVAMMDLVDDSIRTFWADGGEGALEVTAYRRVRFRQRVEPGASLRVRVRRVDGERLRFVVEVGGSAACTGECGVQVAPPAPSMVGVAERTWSSIDFTGRARFAADGTSLAAVLDLAQRMVGLSTAGIPTRVCVASEDRVEVAAAVVAALAGGIDAIFPPALSPEAVLATAHLRDFSVWLGPAAWTEALCKTAARRFAPDSAARATAGWHLGDPARACIFLQTGGTTGQPQLWPKTADNLLAEVAAQMHGLRVEPDDHILATVPPHHIYGLLFSVLLPLCAGATVERASLFYPQEIARRIAASGATILVSTPAHLRALATANWGEHRLRLVLSSGAPLPAADARAFFARVGRWPLEIYGSTETGGIAVRRQDAEDSPWLPMPAVACRSEEDLLAVRSPYVSGSPAVLPDGFFRTADLVGLRPDGRFDLLGRSDGIVKVGGRRVALASIEQELLALPGVTDAAALARPSPSGRGQEIVALVASARAAADIGRELRQRLPSPAWPRRIRCAPAIPVTPSGKRDREAMLKLLEGDEGEAAPA